MIAVITTVTLRTAITPRLTRLLACVTAFRWRLISHFAFKAVFGLPFVTAWLAAFFKPRPVFSNNAEIMVCKLQIIFRQYAITLQLRLTRQILVFFKKLGGIAARAVINPATIILAPAIPLWPTTTTTATTEVPTTAPRPIPSLDDAARRVDAIPRVPISDDPPVVPIARIADVAYGPDPEQVLDVLEIFVEDCEVATGGREPGLAQLQVGELGRAAGRRRLDRAVDDLAVARGVADDLGRHHGLSYADEAVASAVSLLDQLGAAIEQKVDP